MDIKVAKEPKVKGRSNGCILMQEVGDERFPPTSAPIELAVSGAKMGCRISALP